jgi:uncharacterized Tic20 family protein
MPMGAPTPGYANNDEKTWALVSHFGGAAGAFVGGGCLGWIAPLIAMMTKGAESPTVRAHAIAALNFQILCTIVGVVGWITICIVIGFIPIAAAVIVGAIFGVIAGVKANEGQFYRYPITVSLIK